MVCTGAGLYHPFAQDASGVIIHGETLQPTFAQVGQAFHGELLEVWHRVAAEVRGTVVMIAQECDKSSLQGKIPVKMLG